jgi:hypothetical protein
MTRRFGRGCQRTFRSSQPQTAGIPHLSLQSLDALTGTECFFGSLQVRVKRALLGRFVCVCVCVCVCLSSAVLSFVDRRIDSAAQLKPARLNDCHRTAAAPTSIRQSAVSTGP